MKGARLTSDKFWCVVIRDTKTQMFWAWCDVHRSCTRKDWTVCSSFAPLWVGKLWCDWCVCGVWAFYQSDQVGQWLRRFGSLWPQSVQREPLNPHSAVKPLGCCSVVGILLWPLRTVSPQGIAKKNKKKQNRNNREWKRSAAVSSSDLFTETLFRFINSADYMKCNCWSHA